MVHEVAPKSPDPDVEVKYVQRTEVKGKLSWSDFQHLILYRMADKAGLIDFDPREWQIKIEIKQQTEGSPAYHVSKWDAFLVMVKDEK